MQVTLSIIELYSILKLRVASFRIWPKLQIHILRLLVVIGGRVTDGKLKKRLDFDKALDFSSYMPEFSQNRTPPKKKKKHEWINKASVYLSWNITEWQKNI